jgi:anion-transporting  ArsA/GET3 family ATPase
MLPPIDGSTRYLFFRGKAGVGKTSFPSRRWAHTA